LARPQQRASWEQALGALRSASRVVLDLRQPATGSPSAPGWPRVPFSLLELRPSERHRTHTGWRSEGRPDTGAFDSGWNTVESRLPLTLPRVAVVADGRIALPSGVAALLAAGRATVIATGDGSPRFAGERVARIAGVQVRVGEFPAFGPAQRPASSTADPVEMALAWLRSDQVPDARGTFDTRSASVPACQSTDPRVRAIRAFLVVHRLHPYLPRPTAAQSEQTLRALLDIDPAKRIAALRGGLIYFQDGHARARTEDVRDPVGVMQPPVRLRMVDSAPIVTALLHPIAGELGVKLGDRVVAVDGEPVERRRSRLSGWLSGGTDAARGLYVANRLLAGQPEVDVNVVLEGVDRRRRTVRLPRDIRFFSGGRIPERGGAAVRRIGGCAYFDADRLTPESIRSAAFEHRNAKRWILDLRGEARETAWALVPLCVQNGKRIAARFVCPVFRSGAFGSGEWTRSIPLELTPGAWTFRGELVALIDERTQSQSELAALMVRSVGGWLIGTTTAGAVGDVTEIDLGDNSVLSFSGQRVTDQCGSSVHRVGITPRILVPLRRPDIAAGRDRALEAALPKPVRPRAR